MKLKELLYPVVTKPLYQLVNAWQLLDDCLVSVDGSLTYGWDLLELPDLVHMDEGKIDSIVQSWGRAISGLDNCVLQFVVSGRWGNLTKVNAYRSEVNPDSDFTRKIVEFKVKQFSEMDTRRLTYRLYLSQPKGDVFRVVSDPLYFGKIARRVSEAETERLRQFQAKRELFTQSLRSCEIRAVPMSGEAITREFYERLNPKRKLDMVLRPGETLRSQVCLTTARNEYNYAQIGSRYFKAVNLYSRPEAVNFYQIAKFLANLEVAFDAVWTVQLIPDSLKDDAALRKSLKLSATMAATTNTREGRLKAEEIHQMLDETLANSEKIYNLTLAVIVQENNLEYLDKKTDVVLRAFREIGDSEGVIEDMNHLLLYLHTLPGHWFFNRRPHPFSLSAITHLLPLHRPWPGCQRQKILFPTAGGEMIGLDLFADELPAKHGLVIGATGKGKSFTTNYILTNFLIESAKNHVIIIDAGGSYRKICEVFNGQYITLNSKVGINMFPETRYFWEKDEKGEDIPASDELTYLRTIIQKMLKIPELTGRQQTIIEQSIVSAYVEAKKNSSDRISFNDFIKHLLNYPGDKDDLAIASEFQKNLQPWYLGQYAGIFNATNTRVLNLDPQKRLVVFDLAEVVEDSALSSVMFFVVRGVIQSRLRDMQLKKIIVIDEGWQFFSDKAGSFLIENLYRTARKFGGAVFSISQSPEDFLNTPAANAIISNSYSNFFLGLTGKYEMLKQFGLREGEIAEVKHLEMQPGRFSEIFYQFNHQNSVVLRLVPNKLDYWICTTNRDDTNTENKLKQKYPDKTLSEILLMLSQGGE